MDLVTSERPLERLPHLRRSILLLRNPALTRWATLMPPRFAGLMLCLGDFSHVSDTAKSGCVTPALAALATVVARSILDRGFFRRHDLVGACNWLAFDEIALLLLVDFVSAGVDVLR
jgi:hypothetical protein